MSTDLHAPPRQPSPEEGPEKPKSSMSIAQVIGGALAAMTAAALGSRLSVAGTVVGAALASIIAAVGGSVYTASLRRTSQHVSTVLAKVRPTPSGGSSEPTTATTTTPVDPTATRTDWALAEEPESPTPATSDPQQRRRPRLGWKPVVLAAVLMFAVAALALTGIELVTGHALSGGTGTTVGQVADPATRPSATPTDRTTATPSASPSATASAEPSTSSSPVPSSEPTAQPSATRTPAPSATPTAEPSSTPSLSATPSGATPGS